MSRPIPMAACLALLKAFDPDNETPQQTIAAGAAAAEEAFDPAVVATLNTGQWAAVIDLVIWKGANTLDVAVLASWLAGGNFAKPVRYLPTLGPRGAAERDAWNLGAQL